MIEIDCYDLQGNSMDYVTQWDTNQVLYIEDWKHDEMPIFHFCNKNSKMSLVVRGEKDGDRIKAKIPNILLQEPYPVTAFLYMANDESGTTVYVTRIPINKKPKPNDYSYEENIEYVSWAKLEADAIAFLEELERITAEYGTALGMAKENADRAEEYANKASEYKDSAEQLFAEIENTLIDAEKAILDANNAVIEIGELSVEVRENIETLDANLTTLSNTMSADYAKKIEVTDIQTLLQTQITQNANQINSTASIVEIINQTANDAKDIANATKGDVDSIISRVTAAETSISQNAEQIALKATKTEITETLGGYYTKDEADAAIKVSADAITSTVSNKYVIKDDIESLTERVEVAESSITQQADSITSLVTKTESIEDEFSNYSTTLEMNSAINQKADSITQTVSSTYATKTALNETDGKAVAAQNDVNNLADRVTEAETKIDQTSDQIALMAKKTEVEETLYDYYTKTEADAAIKVSADAITSSVSSTYATKDTLSQYSTTTQMNTAINQKADSITSAVSSTYATKETVDGIADRVSKAETSISQTSNSITAQATSIDTLGERVSTVEQTSSGLSVRLTTAEDNITTAQNTANTASNSASEAKTAASNAQSTANTANENAGKAQNTANTAIDNAATAKSAADTAQGTANTAVSNAATAQSTANTAVNNAANAQSTANTARTEAASAAKTATNFMGFDSNGLTIGNNTSGTWSGYRTQIKSDSFNILDNNGSEVATYGANSIYLGKNKQDTVIDLCGGLGQIMADSDLINSLKIKSNGTLTLDSGSARLYSIINKGDATREHSGHLFVNPTGVNMEVSFAGSLASSINLSRADIKISTKALKINDLTMTAFVTEEGTSGSWKYRKWSSGFVELWYTGTVTDKACTTAFGSLYRTVAITFTSFPFTVNNPNVQASFESDGSGAMLFPSTISTTTAPPSYYLVRHTSSTISSGTINFYVTGTY